MTRARIHIRPEDLVCICDTREQLPFDVTPLKMERGTLACGDYSIKGLENLISVERKSLEDLCGVVGRDRERFDREIQRMLAYEARAIVIEANWDQVKAGAWRSKVTSSQVIGSLYSWCARGINVWLAGSREEAQEMTVRFLFCAARHRFNELRSLVDNLKIAE